MKSINKLLILLFFFFSSLTMSIACSPCQALSDITQTVNGTDLELTFTSNAGWQCCYTVQIEIVCSNASFTGVANYFSPEICINGGTAGSSTWATPVPYPLTVIDISGFCPGTYKWRGAETSCGIYTPEYTFTVAGESPILVEANLTEDTICVNDNSQFTASASNGCDNGSYNYSWSPSTGLNNANISNPVASPNATTTYVLTVTEVGSCTAPQTASLTVTVNPLPTATISGTIDVCQNDNSPELVFTGASGTGPYSIDYTLNGFAQTTIIASNTSTLQVPTNIPGVYTYSLTNVQDASSTQCSAILSENAIVTVNTLPTINAGPDQILCEPNDITPSEVTLNGSGALTYTWDNGAIDGESFTPPSGTTTYTVTGTDINGCTNTDYMIVTALIIPIANGSISNGYGNAPLAVEYNNLSQFANSYIWDFGNGSVINVSSTAMVTSNYTVPGIYNVTLTASNGICYDIWTTQIEVLPPMVVTPPNVFTPNGDNSNDLYFVDVKYGEYFEAIILNRWGNFIAELDTLNQGWDGKSNGKEVEDGVYYIKYKATDYSEKEIEGHTYFHLIR